MSWYPLAVPSALSGATLSVVNGDSVLLIGGGASASRKQSSSSSSSSSSRPGTSSASSSTSQVHPLSPLLQIKTLSLKQGVWRPYLINTKGVLNRQHHAAAALAEGQVAVFGGLVASSKNGQVVDDILLIKDTLFGLDVSIAAKGVKCARQGLSAVSTTIPGCDTALLFGGVTADRIFSAELSLYMQTSLDIDGVSEPLIDLLTDGPKPPPRAFHSCVLGGPDNSLLMVYGGEGSEGEMLGDLWICDLSGVMSTLREAVALRTPTPAEPVTEAEGLDEQQPQEEVAKSPPRLPVVTWKCLLQTTSTPRCQHSSYTYNSSVDEVSTVQLCILGGVSRQGKSLGSDKILEISLVLGGDADGYVVADGALDFVVKDSLPFVSSANRLAGAAAVVAIGSDGIADGGVLVIAGSEGFVKVTNDKCKLAVDLRRCLSKNRPATSPQNSALPPAGESKRASNLPRKVKYSNGDVYEGDLRRPADQTDEDPIELETLVRHGQGTMRYADTSETYTGDWSDNLRTGQGASTTHTESYEGSFCDDKRHGRGVLRDSQSGNILYEGAFENGVFGGGEGTQYSQDGEYSGSFSSGQRSGAGTIKNHDTGFVYSGNWKDGKIAGEGHVTDYQLVAAPSSGRPVAIAGTYAGPTLNGVPSGRGGMCIYSDGSEFEGEWKSGLPNGLGRYVAPNHDTFEGKFVGGLRWKGTWKSSNEIEYYEGYWANEKPNGRGERRYVDGTVWEGEWENGLRLDTNEMQKTADLREWGGT